MNRPYRVAIKESVFRETSLSVDEFDDDPTLAFDSKAAAQEWVDEQNDRLPGPGTLNLHKAHPNDSSDVDAYLVSRPGRVWTFDS
jgi:hypothetical protein